jgi:transposase
VPSEETAPKAKDQRRSPHERYACGGRSGKVGVQVAVSTTPGRVDQHHRLSRERFRRFFAQHQSSDVLMEACGTAHHWGRELEAMGHRVRLLPPSDVARYRDGNKTDRADAIAILEASRNEAIDPVPVRTIEQQALTSLHRLRSAYVADRTARINTVRGILREFGHPVPQGARTFVAHARAALGDERLPRHLRDELGRALDEIVAFKRAADEITRRIEALAEQMPDVANLRTVPGIGVLTATALVAFVGQPRRFRSGRHFASFLGLTPKENSSGARRRLAASRRRATPIFACSSSTARAPPCSRPAAPSSPIRFSARNRLAPYARLSIMAGAL